MMKWVLPLLLMLIITGCGGSVPAPVVSYDVNGKTRHTPIKPPKYYVVRSGDTLYSISWRYGLDYKKVASINGINRDYKIYAGQKLYFKSSQVKKKPTTKKSAKYKSTKSKPTRTTKSTPPAKVKTDYIGKKKLVWRWPTKGKVISTYSSQSQYRKGIAISGREGQPVVAAASGKVVYSGNGLPRYGNLVIVKHNDLYLSAYAHNQRLLVKDGQIVKAGQQIATLGQTGSVDKPQLHFEIRRNGKPVNPKIYLP